MEANRFSGWADYNVHYEIKMVKAHIIMICGAPLFYTFTNENSADGLELVKLLERYDGILLKGAKVLSEGSYASHETYLKVFRMTGGDVQQHTLRCHFHKEATFDKLIRAYNRFHNEPDFKLSKYITPEYMFRYLSSHGYPEKVGWFLMNLDMSRGDSIHREDALERHVCETVHHAMKHWVNLDVRGLNRKVRGQASYR